MNRILQAFLQDAHDDLEDDLTANWTVAPGALIPLSRTLKAIHRRQLSLACAATITGLRAPRNEYAQEIVQTSYLSIILAMRGLENATCVLVRQTIELSLKHIYFATHPVEYGWTANRDNYKELSFQVLIEYIKKTNEYKNFSADSKCNLCEPVEDNFAFLSRYVHMQSKRFMTYKKLATPARADQDILQRLDRLSASLWPALTAMLVLHFAERFGRASEAEKSLIRSTFSRETKNSLARYLRNRQSAKGGS